MPRDDSPALGLMPYPTPIGEPDPEPIPADVWYDPKAACFRDVRGVRKPASFDRRFYPRAGEFPVWAPLGDDAAEVGRETTPIGYEPAPDRLAQEHAEAMAAVTADTAELEHRIVAAMPDMMSADGRIAMDFKTKGERLAQMYGVDHVGTIGEADHDPVSHPRHYTSHPSGVECIQITRHMGFCVGNAVKYLWRADLKGGVEDLEKAAWYIADEIAKRKAAEA